MLARTRLMDVAWVLFTSVLVVVGVIAWGWPPGNVFVLFWIENLIVGVVSGVRIATAQGRAPADEPSSPRACQAVSLDAPRWAATGFFLFHYGLFALVHGVFVFVIAARMGLSWDFWTLGAPALLITLRYVVDLATRWFLGEQRRKVSSGEAMAWPYPRVIVLHVATLLGFLSVMPFGGERPLDDVVTGLRQWLDSRGLTLSNGALMVVLLMALKTVADLALLAGHRLVKNVQFSFGRT